MQTGATSQKQPQNRPHGCDKVLRRAFEVTVCNVLDAARAEVEAKEAGWQPTADTVWDVESM